MQAEIAYDFHQQQPIELGFHQPIGLDFQQASGCDFQQVVHFLQYLVQL